MSSPHDDPSPDDPVVSLRNLPRHRLVGGACIAAVVVIPERVLYYYDHFSIRDLDYPRSLGRESSLLTTYWSEST
jgi:hypothetical protein